MLCVVVVDDDADDDDENYYDICIRLVLLGEEY